MKNEISKEKNTKDLKRQKKEKESILEVRKANDWLLRGLQIQNPKKLFGTIWHQGEVAILFANTGKGKSSLAVQIADCISKGENVLGLHTTKSKVIYLDLELTTKSFQLRYTSNKGELHQFNDNFLRAEINRDSITLSQNQSAEECLIQSIKVLAKESDSDAIIIDNISFLSASNEKSKEALELMKMVLEISRKSNKTKAILLLAHTPKRDKFRPIELEDLAGSKALSNFCDVCFCVGESVKGSDMRYIKELKNRNHAVIYDSENIIECQLKKTDTILQFNKIGFGSEKEHLIQLKTEKEEQTERIRELKVKGLSNVKIAKKLGLTDTLVGRRLRDNEK